MTRRPPSEARILVVDDNAALVENVGEILEGAGYAVRGAGTCAAALALAREGFDVALVDLRLPDGDGTALAPQLKEVQPDGEVVLLTGFATLESAVAAVRAGACAYLVKPCATQELLVTVEQAMRQVRLHAEKRELSRRAQMAEKLAAVGTMTAGLSHEIRRLDHILEDFLQFARPREFVPRVVDVATVVNRVLDLLGGEADRRGVRLERNLADVPPVRGDEERLRQVLVNLGLNALEAVRDGGRVRVSSRLAPAAEASAAVEILVDDDGAGVPPESRDRIFEPFFTTKAKGSGLGLSIVHAIVTQHGGRLRVEESPEGGARFVVSLPPGR